MTGLADSIQESTVNVAQLVPVDRGRLDKRIGHVSAAKLAKLDDGLCLVLGL